MGFDHLYDYVNFVETRNKAFTSITRSKGWCRISGIGSNMEKAIKEIKDIIKNVPRFEFTYPTSDKIARKLSNEEHARRIQTKKEGEKSIDNLLNIEDEFFSNLSDEVKAELKKKLEGN